MELTELYTNAKAKMEKCMTSLERDFSAVRAGRANPAVLDKVMVDYYGVPTPVNQMAAISVPEARMLVIRTGNPGMAMAGCGDLLSGMIGSFLAQGLEPLAAAKAGVYIHGLCGDITARELSARGMTVADMTELLGALMSEFE